MRCTPGDPCGIHAPAGNLLRAIVVARPRSPRLRLLTGTRPQQAAIVLAVRPVVRDPQPTLEAVGLEVSSISLLPTLAGPSGARLRRGAATAAEPKSVPVAASGRRGRQRTGSQAAALPEPSAPALRSLPQASGGGAQRRFRVRFVVEQVIEAEQIREVIDRVEALGATEITSIAREN